MNAAVTRRWFGASVLVAGSGLLLFAGPGCVPRDDPKKATAASTSKSEATPIDELTLGFESVRAINNPASVERRPDGTIGNTQITKARDFFHQWLARQNVEAVNWELDPMFRNMPRSIRDNPQFSGIDRLDFFEPDILYLQQCLWLNDIAQRVTKEPASPHLASWLAAMDKAGQIEQATRLRHAERLFDWTVRNIQLEPLLPVPKGPEATAAEGKVETPAANRILEPGPGYLQLPQQTLLNGRGDAWERARIFIQLCRQAEIQACMLATIKDGEPAPLPWLAAVIQGDEFYLFDPQLGLPIPGPNRTGIATLTEFQADPQLLAQLSPAGGPAYPLATADLKAIAVLVEAQPEALSRRMALLEGPFNNARRQSRSERKSDDDSADSLLDIVLTTRPNKSEPKLRKLKHISMVGLWRVPFEAELFQQQVLNMIEVVRQDPKQMSPFLAHRFFEAEVMHFPFELFQGRDGVDRSLLGNQQQKSRAPRQVNLMQGRDYLLRSRWDNYDNRLGARAVFLSSRKPDEEINLIESSPKFRRDIIKDDPRLPVEPGLREQVIKTFEAQIVSTVPRIRRAKDDATYWLGTTYFEEGDYGNAIEWLTPLVQNEINPSGWQSGARYLIARSYEAQGKPEKARELYLADDSPQAAGNKLRAAWIPAAETKTSTADSEETKKD